MNKQEIQAYVVKRIGELGNELSELVDKARGTRAQCEELTSLHKMVTSQEKHDKEEADKILQQIQSCFDENQKAVALYNEKSAVIQELKKLLESEGGEEE